MNSKPRPKPLIAITMGDPAGIGPEIILKAFESTEYPIDSSNIIIIGDACVMEQAQNSLKSFPPIHVISSTNEIAPFSLNMIDVKQIACTDFTTGQVSAACGKAAYRYISTAIELALKNEVAAMVTCPINKEALHLAGFNFPGHTEILAEQCGVKDYSMLFYLDGVAVTHVTTHTSLKNAIEAIHAPLIGTHIRLLNETLKRLGHPAPRIAVAGLNPHAGEHGLFGNEEINHIIPAIEQAQKEGVTVSGPFPPDTVFMRAFEQEFNGVVSMIHDHGFVALKSRDFKSGVNITVGLPIIRTSVGHGTAFDIVGKDKASPKSLIEAVKVAIRLWENRHKMEIVTN